MKKVTVLYNKGKNGVTPTQGYEDDFAYDLYASQGTLVPPLTFKSVAIETDFKTAFDPTLYGMKANLRSGAAFNTPLILSNSTGIIEGTYRNTYKILARNTFIDNRLVDFLFDIKGNRIPVSAVPKEVMARALKFYNEETTLLGYPDTSPEIKEVLYKKVVPAGTIYVAKHDRIAQIHLQEKVYIDLKEVSILPDSVRGENGLGSSGSNLEEAQKDEK